VVILEYGDYECPYSRRAFREVERVERQLGDGVRFAFRHLPLTEIHPNALAASAAAVASGEVLGTPTLFIDGVLHQGSYEAPSLLEALAGRA
jgi:protein-disulfide isomerase